VRVVRGIEAAGAGRIGGAGGGIEAGEEGGCDPGVRAAAVDDQGVRVAAKGNLGHVDAAADGEKFFLGSDLPFRERGVEAAAAGEVL